MVLEYQFRNAQPGDLPQVVEIDAEATGIRKVDYWSEILARYGSGRREQRFFLVAEADGRIDGYVIGEVRDWEFGSPRVGWVFAINVRPEARQSAVGSRLLKAICDGFRQLGVTRARTLLARDNHLVLSFFRSQGMMAAPFIPLEMEIPAPAAGRPASDHRRAQHASAPVGARSANAAAPSAERDEAP